MYRLLIVDDEQIVIDSIRFIVEKNFDNIVVVGGAKSGKDAIEMAEIFKPDIVFMDIKMSSIDGIEAIKEIRKRLKDVIVVIITAYDYFSYAREAVNMNVLEYILKPVSKEKIVESLNRALEVLDQKRQNIQREIEMVDKFKKIVPYLESQFIYSFLLENEAYNNLSFYEEVFGMNLGYGYIILLKIEEGPFSSEGNIKYSIKKYDNFNFAREILKGHLNCLVGNINLNRIIAYVPVPKDEEYLIRNKAIEISDKVKKELEDRYLISCRIGIGRPYDIENFLKSYEEADKALKMKGKERIVHFSDIVAHGELYDDYPLNKEKILIEKVVLGDETAVELIFGEIFDWMIYKYGGDYNRIKNRLFELMVVLLRFLSMHGFENVMAEQEKFKNIIENSNAKTLKVNFVDNLIKIIFKMKKLRNENINKTIREVMDYIEKNYDKEITLDDIAKKVNLSYHYFSKFFKEETGRNFSDYLMEIRIEKAKEFLKDDPSLNIKEVSYMVGYRDPNYFSKIFKKIVGVKPTEYREWLLKLS